MVLKPCVIIFIDIILHTFVRGVSIPVNDLSSNGMGMDRLRLLCLSKDGVFFTFLNNLVSPDQVQNQYFMNMFVCLPCLAASVSVIKVYQSMIGDFNSGNRPVYFRNNQLSITISILLFAQYRVSNLDSFICTI